MQTYNRPAVSPITYADGVITQQQLQAINTNPVPLVSNPTGAQIPIFFNLFFRMELNNLFLPFQLYVTSQFNINTFGQQLGILDIPTTRSDSYYVLQPSQTNPFIDSPIFTATALTSDNNLLLWGSSNDGVRVITRDIEYRVFYSIYQL